MGESRGGNQKILQKSLAATRFITYALAKLIAGKFVDAKPAVLVLALIFALKFAIG